MNISKRSCTESFFGGTDHILLICVSPIPGLLKIQCANITDKEENCFFFIGRGTTNRECH